MMTAELLAESGNTVLYLDADIAHHGGTSEWCQRAKVSLASYQESRIRHHHQTLDKYLGLDGGK